jgi:hypothetical protein
MATEAETTLSGGTFEALQHQSAQSRRIRPPDLDIVSGDENRVPLKADAKLGRRESKLGLRSFFGRTKSKDLDGTSSQRDLSRPGGIRASLAEISNWPYGFHAPRSEATLASQSRPASTVFEQPGLPAVRPRRPANAPPARQKTSPTGRTRGSLATWDPPPLFQAYPQAIRHAQLPSSTHSADSILRMSERKQSRDESPQDDDDKSDKRKKHRRNLSASSGKGDWTTKIYVLCTSGYLLQYSGEGSFDRLPEKMLHLGKDSAAFASDVIPGRHWVLQVASVMDSDGTSTADSRSLFSRIPFRATEKRHASNFLMVFESAEEMESWIAVLRREIEALGGKKNLSETGKPKADDNILQLKAQPSQRTLVVRDPDRFSRILTPDPSWPDDFGGHPNDDADADGSITVVDPDSPPEQPGDDVSTTNSVVSHDGRQLENLRDSANRLSYISSGQRTIITSAASSPACSPTRSSFASHLEDGSREALPEVCPRPNAAAILDRRQSLQFSNPFVDVRMTPPRPQPPPLSLAALPYESPLHPLVPNFSVPHSSGRRYSAPKSPHFEAAPVHDQAHSRPLGSRRSPPTALNVSRPLSIVTDQPSPDPDAEFSTRPSTRHSETPSESDPTISLSSLMASAGQVDGPNSYDVPFRRDSLGAKEHFVLTLGPSPRKASSMHARRNSVDIAVPPPEGPRYSVRVSREIPAGLPSPPPIPVERDEARRCRSSMDHYPRVRSRSPPSRAARHIKRASLQNLPLVADKHHHYHHHHHPARFSIAASLDGTTSIASLMGPPPRAPPSCPVPPTPPVSMHTLHTSRSMSPSSHLRADSQSKHLFSRKSMPQLVDGPPPAPPPTCALPPIPQKMRVHG